MRWLRWGVVALAVVGGVVGVALALWAHSWAQSPCLFGDCKPDTTGEWLAYVALALALLGLVCGVLFGLGQRQSWILAGLVVAALGQLVTVSDISFFAVPAVVPFGLAAVLGRIAQRRGPGVRYAAPSYVPGGFQAGAAGPSPVRTSEPPLDRTVLARPPTQPTARLTLQVTAGPSSGHRFAVDGAGVTLGRTNESTISIPDPQLSRRHARIDVRDGVFWLTDLHSANGTRLNGAPVTGALPLRDGDVIQAGTTQLVVGG